MTTDLTIYQKRVAAKRLLAKQKLQSSQSVSVLREETGEIISAPSSLSGHETAYLDDTQNKGFRAQDFLGFVKVGANEVADLGKAAVGWAQGAAVSLEAGSKAEVGELYASALSRPFKFGDLLDPLTLSVTLDRIFLDEEGEAKKIEKMQGMAKVGFAMQERNQKWLKDNGLVAGEDASTYEKIKFDVGGVGGSIGTSLGIAGITRMPGVSALLFGFLQKSTSYIEARKKGFSPETSQDISNAMGLTEGVLEFFGVNLFLKASGANKGLKLIGMRALEESLQEGSQQSAEEIISQTSGLRDIDPKGGVGRVLYSMILGAIGGGGVASVIEVGKSTAKEEGVPEDIVEPLANNLAGKTANIEAAVVEMLEQEISPLKVEPHSEAKVAEIMRQFAAGEDIDVSKLDERDRMTVESLVDKTQEQINSLQATVKSKAPIRQRIKFLNQELAILNMEMESLSYQINYAVENGKPTVALEKRIEAVIEKRKPLIAEAENLEDEGLLRVIDPDFTNKKIVTTQGMIDKAIIKERRKTIQAIKVSFNEGVRVAKKDVKASQTALIETLEKSGLRPEDRAKFIHSIKNIQTPKQLEKKAHEIEAKVVELLEADQKRTLREKIKRALSAAKKSKNLAIDTIESLKVLEDRLYNTGVLGAGIRSTPVQDFVNAMDDIRALTLQGKARLTFLKEQKKQRFVERIEDLSFDSKQINNTDLKRASLGEQLGIMDNLRNLFTEGANRAQRLGLNKNPMDVIFDIMDGFKNYQGANSRIFKQKVDASFGRYLQLKESVTREVKALSDKLKLDGRNYDRIGAYAAVQQEGGIDKLRAAGITQAEIDALQLNEAEMQMYQLMREKLDSLRPALKEVMRVVYNKDFKNVKDYFPFMTDFKAMSELEIQEMFGDDAFMITDEKADFNKKDVNKGFTKERTGGKQKIRIDAMGVFLGHVDNAAYLIEMGQDIKELGELATSNEFQGIAGDLGQQIVVDWINLLARKGRVSGNIAALDTLRVNTGAAVLGFKLSSALVQPTALLDGSAFVGGDYVTRGVVDVTRREWREFIYNNMPEIRERVGDDPGYLDMGGDSVVTKVRDAGFWALKHLDMMAASSVAAGAYTKAVEQNGGKVDMANPDPEAIAYAQLAVRRSQSSTFAKDAAPIISQGKFTSEFFSKGNVSVDKLILQFQSFMLNRWSLIEHDMWNAGIRRGKTAQAMNIATWLILANIAEYSIRHYTRELVAAITGAEPPEDDKELDEKVIRQALSNVPIVSSLVNSAQFGSVPVPSISLWESFFDELEYAGLSKSEEKKTKHYAQAAILGVGGTLGIPGTLQAQQLARGAIGKDKENKKPGMFNP